MTVFEFASSAAFWIFFISWLILPFLAWRYRRKIGNGAPAIFWAFLLTLLIGSLLYMAHLWVIEWELKFAWDPDGNGQLDDPTPENSEKMDRWAADTGRYASGYFSIPVTFLWAGLNFALFVIVATIKQKLSSEKVLLTDTGTQPD